MQQTMYRKIIMNFLIGLLLPIALSVQWLPNVYDAFFKGVYKYYDFRIGSLREFLYHVYGNSYFIDYVLFLIMFLLPFQLIKDHYYKIGKRLSFYKKILLFSLIVGCLIIFWGLFSNIWIYPIYHNLIYLVYAFGSGVIFGSLLYFSVDRYVEK